MSSKEEAGRGWCCHGCGATGRSEPLSGLPPRGWTTRAVVTSFYTTGLDLCPECSRDPDAARRRHLMNLGR